eukprot:2649950-Rhodomonas_salina.2
MGAQTCRESACPFIASRNACWRAISVPHKSRAYAVSVPLTGRAVPHTVEQYRTRVEQYRTRLAHTLCPYRTWIGHMLSQYRTRLEHTVSQYRTRIAQMLSQYSSWIEHGHSQYRTRITRHSYVSTRHRTAGA